MTIVRYLMVLGILIAVAGCRGKEEEKTDSVPDAAEQPVKDVKKADKEPAEPEAKAQKSAYPKAKLPGYLEKTKNMPAGMEKAMAVKREYIAEQLAKTGEKLTETSKSVAQAERKARSGDPQLGLLYKKMLDARIAYNRALAANPVYAEAKTANTETWKRYHDLIERQKKINKEMKNVK